MSYSPRSLLALPVALSLATLLACCGGDDAPAPADLGADAPIADLGVDAAALDAALGDAGNVDGGGACTRDSECSSGTEWCVEGACVPCDNSAFACDILCGHGWSLYTRNDCHPCACAPANECASDAECAPGEKCAAGAFCWCSAADASCCQGNICVPEACDPPPPVGCVARGCPVGEECNTTAGCASSGCACDTSSGTWGCLPDCGGGICEVAP